MRNWRVRWKLIAVVLVPTVATVGLAGTAIASSVGDTRAYDRVVALSRLGGEVTGLVHELQKERDLSSGYVGSGRANNADQEISAQRSKVEEAQLNYLEAADKIDTSHSTEVAFRVDRAKRGLSGLPKLRRFIDQINLTRGAIIAQYDGLIDQLLDVDAAIATEGDSPRLSTSVRVLDDFSRAKEFTSQVRGELFATLENGTFTIGQFEDFVGLVEGADAAIEQFKDDADADDEGRYADTVSGVPVSDSRKALNSTIQEARRSSLTVEPGTWYTNQTARIDLMREVETQLLNNVVTISEDLRSSSQRRALLAGLVLLGVLGFAALATYVVARSMTRPLRLLRSSALEVADRRLPAVIERLRRPDAGNLGDIRVEPVGIESRDEIGEVAQAFDAVHREAVRLASDQAQLRQSVNAMFVNLSRRSQGLVERQLRLIDELESGEQNPDQLENLFKLDHLATRMRRTDDSLLVLAGSETGRGWSQPMPLPDVLLASISEVEQYTRITRTTVTEASVIGYAVSDVVHLLAELMENATAFSPPETTVTVSCRKLSGRGGAMIEIEDHGIGMTAEELESANARLAAPPIIDVAVVRTMGLFVVGRLANKHNIRVQLRGSPHSGITALVLLPPALITDTSGDSQLTLGESGARIGSHAQANQDYQLQPPGFRQNGLGAGMGMGVDFEPQNLEPSPIFDSVSEWFRHRRRIDHDAVPAEQAAHQGQARALSPPGYPSGPPPAQRGPGPQQAGQPAAHAPQQFQGAPAGAGAPPLPRRSPEAVRPPGPHGPGPRGPQPPSPAPHPQQGQPQPVAQQQPPPQPPQQPPQGMPRRTPAAPQQQPPMPPPQQQPEPVRSWTSPADEGWRAAEAASAPSYERVTAAGLPVRSPRAHLIPGSAGGRPELAPPPSSAAEPPRASRSPENVRSMLSTYYSSYRRGRTDDNEAADKWANFSPPSDDQEGS